MRVLVDLGFRETVCGAQIYLPCGTGFSSICSQGEHKLIFLICCRCYKRKFPYCDHCKAPIIDGEEVISGYHKQ